MFLKMHFKKAEKSFLKGNILVPKRHSISLTQKNHLNYYKMCRCISNVPSFFFWLDSSSSKRSRSGGLATASNSIYVNLLRKLLQTLGWGCSGIYHHRRLFFCSIKLSLYAMLSVCKSWRHKRSRGGKHHNFSHLSQL